MNELFNVEGTEGLYAEFVRIYGTRERVNDIISPNIAAIGDIVLPFNSIFHYQASVKGEVGPSNTYPFISNYPARVNMYFNLEYEKPLGSIKEVKFDVNKMIKRYEGAHFIYTRTRNYTTVMSKQKELIVNNLAIGSCNIVYKNRTIYTPFQESYNELLTLLTSVNEFATYGRHQFIEIKLPKTFPTFKQLEQVFIRYKNFFDENYTVTKYEKVPLVPFQAESSYWLLDLYAFLIGYDLAPYSLFSKLSDAAVDQLEIIFSYNGKCWITNLGVIKRLLSSDDKPGETKPNNVKINKFKTFYLKVISLVNPISEEELKAAGKKNGEDETSAEEGEGEDQGEVSTPATDVGTDPAPRDLADLYSSTPRPSDVQPDTEGNASEKNNNEPPIGETDEISLASSDPNSVDNWGKEVDDSLFETATVEDKSVNVEIPYSPTASIERELDKLSRTGGATSKEIDYFRRVSQSYKDIEIDGKTIDELINYGPEDVAVIPENIAPDSISVPDKSALKSDTQRFRDDYIKNVMNKQIVEAILHVQNGKVALLDLQKEITVTADSKYVVYTGKFQPIGGSQSTRRMRIPLVETDGTFTINGVKSYSQNLRVEKPIRKLTPTKVALTSYYPRKIMIERSTAVADDYVRWLKRAIVKASREGNGFSVKLGGKTFTAKGICFYYSILASRFKEIQTKEFLFNFDMEKTIEEKGWGKYCNEETWVVGEHERHPLLIDKNGFVSYNGNLVAYIETILNVDMKKAPVGHSTVNISGYKFPAVVVLSYWMGFSRLMEMIGANYRVASIDKQIKIEPDEFMVNFSDERLIFSRRDRFQSLILAGLLKLDLLKNYSRSHLDDPTIWFSLINDSRVRPSHFKEMENIFNMFIDPFCARRLKSLGYPTEMDKLTIEGIKLLLSNEAPHEVEITEQVLIGYEKFAGHIYSEMCKANRQLWNKPNSAKKTFDLNPEAVMMGIITDTSTQVCEEVNPVSAVKQCEEVTFGGTFGRNERAMVRRTRGQLDNYAGVISEAGKDSGKVGFVTYLTSDAKIADMYGTIDLSKPDTNTGKGSVALNLFYGGTKESAQRTMFTGVQASQMMATNSYEINPIRMSYDTMVAYRTGEMYSSIAKEDGKVVEVTEYGIKVQYENGKEDRFPIGYDVGKGGGEYHKHYKITDVKVGDTFKAGKILAWDELYFARDPFDSNRVVFKTGMMVRVGLFEEQYTFEDSMGLTSDFARRSNTPFLKSDSFIVRADQSIKLHAKVGDYVEYDSILCDIQDPISSVFGDDGELDGLERYGIKQQKAKLAGVITKIDVTYNGDIEDWDKDLKKFIKSQDSHRAKVAQYKYLTASNGNVGGNTSIGKSKVYPDTALVTITIEANINSTTADKFVLGNQMKGTVGYIYPNSVKTLDGRPVDIIFSVKSILARMVLSMRDKLACNEVNNVWTLRMIEKYGTDLN